MARGVQFLLTAVFVLAMAQGARNDKDFEPSMEGDGSQDLDEIIGEMDKDKDGKLSLAEPSGVAMGMDDEDVQPKDDGPTKILKRLDGLLEKFRIIRGRSIGAKQKSSYLQMHVKHFLYHVELLKTRLTDIVMDHMPNDDGSAMMPLGMLIENFKKICGRSNAAKENYTYMQKYVPRFMSFSRRLTTSLNVFVEEHMNL